MMVKVDHYETSTGESVIGIFTQMRDKDEVKKIPGARWRHNEGLWVVPLSWAAMCQLRGVFGDRLEVGEKLSQMAWEVYELRIKPCLELRDSLDAPWVPEPLLFPLQKVGAAFAAIGRRTSNCDPMGSGKTPQTIVATRVMEERGIDPFPLIVICGNGAKPHWEREFKRWREGTTVSVVKGSAAQRRKALEAETDVYVINWEALRFHSRLAGYGAIALSDKEKELKELNEMFYRSVIVDEVHRGINPKAKQTRAAYAICDRAENIFALTGSLISNTPEDMWSPMRIVDPREYPSKGAFVERYGLLSFNTYGYMEVVGIRGDTREELFKFFDPRMLRRPKELILPELAKNGKLPIEERFVPLAPKQRKAYEQMRKEMIAELDGGVLMTSNPMTKVLRLRQLCGATGVIVPNEDPEAKPELDLVDPSSKIDELEDIVQEAEGASICVYAESKKLVHLAVERLQSKGIDAVEYSGNVNDDQREINRQQFQDGEAQVIILTYATGSESIDLSRAAILVRLEYHRSSIKNSQAEERPVRKGRTEPLLIIDVMAEDTVDAGIKDDYGDKLDNLQELMRDEERLKKLLEMKP